MYRIILGILIFVLALLMIFIEVSAYKRRNGNATKIENPKNNLHMLHPPTGGSTQEKE